MNTKMLCLAALSLGKASGYDIGKRLDDPLGYFVDTAKSGVYPALKSLHEEGLVQYEDIEQSSLPNKKLFELTPKGKEILHEELEALAPTHKVRSKYMLLLFLSEMLSVERLEEVIREHLSELEHFLQQLPHIRKLSKGKPGQEFLVEYLADHANNEKAFIENNLEALLDKTNSKRKEMESVNE